MKKVICSVLAALLLFGSAALADVDLSGMSYEELLDLQARVTAALWASDAWQEVQVPAGIYLIGRDIPAGKWTISYQGNGYGAIKWGDTLNDSGTEVEYSSGIYAYAYLKSPDRKSFDESDTASVTWDLVDGTYLFIDQGTVTFTPPAGLGFKFK